MKTARACPVRCAAFLAGLAIAVLAALAHGEPLPDAAVSSGPDSAEVTPVQPDQPAQPDQARSGAAEPPSPGAADAALKPVEPLDSVPAVPTAPAAAAPLAPTRPAPEPASVDPTDAEPAPIEPAAAASAVLTEPAPVEPVDAEPVAAVEPAGIEPTEVASAGEHMREAPVAAPNSAGIFEPPPASAPDPMHGIVAFAANIASGGLCHRDAMDGADMFIGLLDLNSGTVMDVRLIDDNPGPQWCPALSPDGALLAYNDSADGRLDRIVVVELATMARREIAPGGRFPAFSHDGRLLYYSREPQGRIMVYDLDTLVQAPIATRDPGSEPCPVGRRFIGYMARPAGGAAPVLRELATGRETSFSCAGCGHMAAWPAGDRVALLRAADSAVLACRYSEEDGRWGVFEDMIPNLDAAMRAADPGFAAAGRTLFSRLRWPFEDVMAFTAQSAVFDARARSRLRTTGSRLFLVRLAESGPVVIPLRFQGPAGLSFEPQAMTCDILAGLDLRAAAQGLPFRPAASGPAAAETSPAAGAPICVLVTLRTGAAEYGRAADYIQDKAAYTALRAGVVRFAEFMKGCGAAWSFEPDHAFMLGVLKHEVADEDPELLASTGYLNIVRHLAGAGVEIRPGPAAGASFNHADIAHMIRRAGAEPAPVLGAWSDDLAPTDSDGLASLTNWIEGIEFGAAARWKASILVCAPAGQGRSGEQYASGVWRPKSRSEFYVHDPGGTVLAVGGWRSDPDSMQRLTDAIRDGSALTGRLYTVSVNADALKLADESHFKFLTGTRLASFIDQRDAGLAEFARPSDIPRIWRERFNEQGYVYGPFTDTIRRQSGGRQGAGR